MPDMLLPRLDTLRCERREFPVPSLFRLASEMPSDCRDTVDRCERSESAGSEPKVERSGPPRSGRCRGWTGPVADNALRALVMTSIWLLERTNPCTDAGRRTNIAKPRVGGVMPGIPVFNRPVVKTPIMPSPKGGLLAWRVDARSGVTAVAFLDPGPQLRRTPDELWASSLRTLVTGCSGS